MQKVIGRKTQTSVPAEGRVGEQPAEQKSWLKKHGITLLIVAALIIGVCIMLYPTVANYWNSFHQSRSISTYMENVTAMQPEEYDELIAKARDYNRKLAQSGLKW